MTPLFDTRAYHSCTVFSVDTIYRAHYDGILEQGGTLNYEKFIIMFHIRGID